MPIPDTTLTRRADNMRDLTLAAGRPTVDTLVADLWLDTLCLIQRRGHTGTISQALDDIEAAMERADAIESATPATA